jgi:molybdenum cofactor cytidylyltransferase
MTSYAIIPAAGRSRRMGSPKLLLPWGDSTLIGSVLGAWRASRIDWMIVVVHPQDLELADSCRGERVTVVVPHDPPPEMKDSVAAALRHIEDAFSPGPRDCWLLAPADMPNLCPRVIDRLLDEHDRSAKAARLLGSSRAADSPLNLPQQPSPRILAPAHGGRRGHPVLFPWSMASEVHGLSADEGVNQLLKRHAVVEVPCAPDELGADLDTMEDYRRLMPRQ